MIVKCANCQKEHDSSSDSVVKVIHKKTGKVSWFCNNGFCAIAQQLGTIGNLGMCTGTMCTGTKLPNKYIR